MKTLMAIALVATPVPFLATAALAEGSDSSTRERRHCTQVTLRAGSRMSGRRICRTAAQWRETLGIDWRQHLAGNRGVQDDYDTLQVLTTPVDGGSVGQQGEPFSASRQRGPR